MIDPRGRKIDYMRFSLTDRCNLRCIYCMPGGERGQGLAEGRAAFPHREEEEFSTDEAVRLCRAAVSLGIFHVRLTGGEPLIRRDLALLAERLVEEAGVQRLSLTTNGVLLPGRAGALYQAGIRFANISLDTLLKKRFEKITGTQALNLVLTGIDEAVSCGMEVKLNCTVLRGINDDEIPAFAAFSGEKKIPVRFIELMPIGCGRNLQGMENTEVLHRLRQAYPGRGISSLPRMGDGPARYLSIEGTGAVIGLISPLSGNFCSGCNRIRVTADGSLMACLSGPPGVNVRKLMREGCGDEQLLQCLRETVSGKPPGHHFVEKDRSGDWGYMNQIGG